MMKRVRGIARRIESQTKVFHADAPGWPWEADVISSKQLNAFCTPGGKIMVFSGLITQLQLTDPGMAIILAYEIAHALREHSREQMSQAIAAQAGRCSLRLASNIRPRGVRRNPSTPRRPRGEETYGTGGLPSVRYRTGRQRRGN